VNSSSKYFSRMLPLLAFTGVILSGCSSTTLAYKDTLMLAFVKGDDVDLSLQAIVQRPMPALYVRKDDNAKAMLALQEGSLGLQKWISADLALVVLQNGRLVKMLGFDEQQLQGQVVLQQDWLTKPLKLLHLADKSQLVSDWRSVQHQGVTSHITIVAIEDEQLAYFSHTINVIRVDEQVDFGSGDFVVNSFWFSAKNGMLLKSRQQPLPNWSVFELEYISDIAKNLSVIGKSNL